MQNPADPQRATHETGYETPACCTALDARPTVNHTFLRRSCSSLSVSRFFWRAGRSAVLRLDNRSKLIHPRLRVNRLYTS